MRMWAKQLPERLKTLCTQWGLEIVDQESRSTWAVVFLTRRENAEHAFLKVTYSPTQLAHEINAYEAWALADKTNALVELIAHEHDAVLTRAVAPGVMQHIPSELVTDLFARLHVAPADHCNLRSQHEDVWGRLTQAADRIAHLGAGQVTLDDVSRARERLSRLIDAEGNVRGDAPTVLVHGDLTAGNILLDAERQCLYACDPKGAIGDGHYDVAMFALLCERYGHHLPRKRLQAAGYDFARVQSWMSVIATHELVSYVFHDKNEEHRPIMRRHMQRS